MFSANQITRFLIQLFLKNKSMKQPHFLHADTNSQKLKVLRKFFAFAWSKMSVANLVTGLQNWLYLKNEQVELTDICILVQIHVK